ncbi:type II toxin-antitoxin system PemK/MazF family toxin [bacterium]|nr:type II toxin-antitoxin system PemK/MazF family toxin [bacterium]
MRRGDILWADLAPRSGSDQTGRRPVLLVSNDGFNDTPTWRSLIVVPLTTAVQNQSPTTVHLPLGTASLSRESLVLGNQITTLDRTKLLHRIGTLPGLYLQQVERAILRALALPAIP